MRAFLALAAILLALAGCGSGRDDEQPLVVSAAASLTEALERCSGGARLSFAGSDELAAQIRRGAKVDVFAAANERLPRELYREGRVERPRAFATNELVVAVPAGSDLRELADVARPGTKLVIGAPGVPVGAYTRDVLVRLPARRRLAILGNVRSEEPDVKGIVGKLTQGAADAGFVYASDVAAAGDRLRAIHLPDRLKPAVAYGAAVVARSDHAEAARRYVDGLVRGTCARALREAGFGAPPGS